MLSTRILTALLLLAGFLATLFLLPFAGWLIFASLIAGLGGWEWGGLLKLGRTGRWSYAIASFVICTCLGWLAFEEASGRGILWAAFGVSGLFWLLLVPVWLREKWPTEKSLAGLLAGWIVLIPACLALAQLRAADPRLLLACMAAVWVADIAAFFSGRTFGRRKLAPAISPGKTWEGAAGALVGVLVYGFVVAGATGFSVSNSMSYIVFTCLLVGLTGLSILGDLFESLAKRQAGIKDSGSLLPGHGGVLDRIDSLTSTLPMVGLILLVREGMFS